MWVGEAFVQVRRMIVGAMGVNRRGRWRQAIHIKSVRNARGSDLHAGFEEAMYVLKAGIEL